MDKSLILLEFENVFEENRDTTIIDKLTTEEEMSGLLNVVLIALKRLIKNNEFDYTKDIETVRKVYELNSNTMAKFVQEGLEIIGPNNKDYEICRDVYGDYVDLCNKEGRRCRTDGELGTYLKMALAGRWGGKHRKRINGAEEYVYYGIRLKKQDSQWVA